MTEWNDVCYIHVDLDAFFASVEQLDHEEYRGKPVIVGGNPKDRRGVVSTASYEARKFGVHSAMPTFKAYSLCPQGIFVYPNMKRYHELSKKVMDIFKNYSPDVRQISIDEAFIDLCGTEKLFGNPSETAKKIKAEVKEKTGLTVSAGLAQNRYIAKIASGLSKPDGFFEVPPGKEEEFMLSLPLEKVWGIGTKTQIKLKNFGLTTTRQIHEKSLTLLQSILGKACGLYLYNAVRGKEVETFSEAKSHSISAETTFPFDLEDRYAIGTALLHLSDTVMFRLLNEKLSSKTAALKIRYGDFSTITVQETSAGEILSSEDLFERVQRLFDKKNNPSNGGIRLLGVAVQNIGNSLYQSEFFNEKSEKKRKLEQSILALQKKKPEIKIKKARLLGKNKKNFIFALFLLSAVFLSQKSYAEEMNKTESDGAGAIIFDKSSLPPDDELKNVNSKSIFNYQIDDKNVEFSADGYWQSEITGGFETTFGFGNSPQTTTIKPQFTQKVDLTLWFMLNQKWYFEAAFADGFDKNTVAAGYYGEGILKEARVANRGITFPATYSIDNVNRGIGGGNNQAPGLFLHFEDDEKNKWKGDFTFRYDMLESKSKTYYGRNSVSDTGISPGAWLTGQIYVLPDNPDFITDIKDVYVESADGDYKDVQGRKYKKLSESQYMLMPARRQLLLAKDCGSAKKNGIVPAVAVSFASASTCTAINSALGAYGTVSDNTVTGAEGFLGAIQEYFGTECENDDSIKRPFVAHFSFGGRNGTGTDGFFSYIGASNRTINSSTGEQILYLQHPAGFSPFAAAFRYDAGTGSLDDAVIASKTTQTESSLYTAIVSDDVSFTTKDFFSENRTYIDIYPSDVNLAPNSAVKPEVRFPLADRAPEFYLGLSSSSDLFLRLRSYSPVTRFDIGTSAVPGTVRLYKNGVIDGNVKYNEESGTVTPSSAVSESDRIYITWYEDSQTENNGAVTAAAGYSRNFTENLTGDISFSTRWAYNPNRNYADELSSTPGFATFATGINYKDEKFLISNTSAFTVESDNTTGVYRILGMDSHTPETIYLKKNAAANLPENFVPVLNTRTSVSDYPTLSDSCNGSVSADEGSTDSEISGYKVPLEWDFTSWEDQAVCAWSAKAIKLGASATQLASATEFSIAIKPDDISVNDYDVYLQLGVSSDEDFSVEDTAVISTWKICDHSTNSGGTDVEKAFNPLSPSFAENIVKIKITEEDRAKFTSNHDARIIVVVNATTSGAGSNNSLSNSNKTGKIWIGPYEIQTQDLFTSQSDNLCVTTSQTTSNLTGVGKLNHSTNYVENVQWANSNSTDTDKTNIVMTRYFSEVDITPYQDINIYFNFSPTPNQETDGVTTYDSETVFSLVLDRNAKGISNSSDTAVKLELSGGVFKNYADSIWHKLTIDRIAKKAYIDGDSVQANSIYINTKHVPSRLKIDLKTSFDGKIFKKGDFQFDELHLSGAKEHYLIEDKVKTEYKKEGYIFENSQFAFLKNFLIGGEGRYSATVNKIDSDANEKSFEGSSYIGISAANIALSGDISHTGDSSAKLSSAGHKAETEEPLFSILKFNEEYRFNSIEKTLDKRNSASLDFTKISIPFSVNGETQATSNPWAVTQNTSLQTRIKIPAENMTYIFSAGAQVNQKLLPSSQNASRLETSSYNQGWKDSTEFAFSSGKSNAARRKVHSDFSNTFVFPFAKLSPQIDFETNGEYKSSASNTFTDSSKIIFYIPFALGSNNISLRWTKESGGIKETLYGGNYQGDTEKLASTLQEREFLFSSLPVNDLISSSLSNRILSNTSLNKDSTESLYYTTTYSISWRRPVFGTEKDLYIPSGISFSAARDIRTSAIISDIYQYKATVNYSAFNIFGESGILKKTKLFKQDEYMASFSTGAKIPRKTGEKKYIHSGYFQSNFYYNESDSVRFGTELTFENKDIWNVKETALWKRRGKVSPILGIIMLFNPEYNKTDAILTRSDSINFSISENTTGSTTNSKVIKKHSFEINHSVDLKMNKNLTIISSLAETYNCTWDSLILLNINASIGARMEF
ncbi:MAG: DNA polymerase IV [Treponema sp.]|nr:DNA polymerase IV [Treponema sp.]